jgi:hypothetical protein
VGTRFVKPRVSRLYLRIPRSDWPNVTQGRKTELRAAGRGGTLLAAKLHTPTPVVGYAVGVVGPRFKLLVVEEAWTEPLGAISAESLEREGFRTRAEFRAYWRRRVHDRNYKPLTTVQVYRLRPFVPEDRAALADRMFDHLYGEYLHA